QDAVFPGAVVQQHLLDTDPIADERLAARVELPGVLRAELPVRGDGHPPPALEVGAGQQVDPGPRVRPPGAGAGGGLPPQAELVPHRDDPAAAEVDLDHLGAADPSALTVGLTGQAGGRLAGPGVEHVPGVRVGEAAVDAEGGPAVAAARQLNALDEPGGRPGDVEDVDLALVVEPDLPLVRGQADAVAQPLLPLQAGHPGPVEDLARP